MLIWACTRGQFEFASVHTVHAADMVFLTFVDDERGFVLTENFVCEHTNYGHCEARNIDEPADWLPA